MKFPGYIERYQDALEELHKLYFESCKFVDAETQIPADLKIRIDRQYAKTNRAKKRMDLRRALLMCPYIPKYHAQLAP